MRIEHVTLLVSDRQKTIDFFTDKLGFDYKVVGRHAWIIVGSQYIHITENSGKPVGGTFYHFAIERANLVEYANQLRKKGVELIDEVHGRSFFVRDLDGNLIEFVQPYKD